ncbi:MAG TPA: Holliday junction resolvase RecU [Bacilli bacterium]|nr:Holliday junction resolvase RecU [Bacilli bacterium]HPS18597.1 Holliday junction resolvase RecU [Bacilli bacterium]
MMIKYPNGEQYHPIAKAKKKSKEDISFSSANRGMSLEEDINLSNDHYLTSGILLITKRPTPIRVVKVDYSKGAKIIDAFFQKQSTTDYNGVYKGRYIDFEAKSTKNRSCFPLSNVSLHQIEHLKNVLNFGGIAFFIIEFAYHDQVYLLDASYVIDCYEHGERKSIPFATVCEKGVLIKRGYNPRLDYLPALDNLYFNK